MIDLNYIEDQMPGIGEVVVSKYKNNKLFGCVLKSHIDEKNMKTDVFKCTKILVNLIEKFGITHLALVNDPEMLNARHSQYFLELLGKKLEGKRIQVTLYKNTLPVPPVEERLKVILACHEDLTSTHHGAAETAVRVAERWY